MIVSPLIVKVKNLFHAKTDETQYLNFEKHSNYRKNEEFRCYIKISFRKQSNNISSCEVIFHTPKGVFH